MPNFLTTMGVSGQDRTCILLKGNILLSQCHIHKLDMTAPSSLHCCYVGPAWGLPFHKAATSLASPWPKWCYWWAAVTILGSISSCSTCSTSQACCSKLGCIGANFGSLAHRNNQENSMSISIVAHTTLGKSLPTLGSIHSCKQLLSSNRCLGWLLQGVAPSWACDDTFSNRMPEQKRVPAHETWQQQSLVLVPQLGVFQPCPLQVWVHTRQGIKNSNHLLQVKGLHRHSNSRFWPIA